MIRDIRDRETRILEGARRVRQPCVGEIALGSGEPSSEEAAHERAREHVELSRELAHRRARSRGAEDEFKEAPAVHRHADQVQRELSEGEPNNVLRLPLGQRSAQLLPTHAIPHVDELSHATLAEGEHRLRGLRFDPCE